ncbi:MAG: hypothetical protein N839_0015350 [Desulfofustis sp. PB-SRB1]|jgi:hypothetical protein|nr:hypothetical protein [Desulfofustis sp. PB-SRB1]MBM1003772.1 hypothetical protein [Desulfofustis sp. PB-SRB1]
MGKIHLGTVIDPRGQQNTKRLQLAPRPSLEELRKGPILFYDNTKLAFCNYMETFTRLKERLREEGFTNFVDFVETVRGKSTQDQKDWAAYMAKEKPVAAFVAMGDMGTSSATTIVAIALEELGIPTLYFTAPPGTNLVRAVANYRAGHLCITSVDIYQASTIEEVRAEIDNQWREIMDALLLTGEDLEKRADLNYKFDKDVAGNNGLINLTERIQLDTKEADEPAAGIEEITDLFNEIKIGDGLPIIPPSRNRYDEMLSYCPFDPDMVMVEEIGPTGNDIHVRDLVVSAVMAGCKPQAMPIVVTAFKALANKKYNFHQSVTTSHPGGNLVLVSGPLAQEVGIHSGQGCLGPGFPANLTIGRAVNLAIINTCRSIPGVADLANISSQAELTYCFAEDSELSPWETINAERYDEQTTTVYVMKAEPIHDIIELLSNNAYDLLDTIVHCSTTLGSNNAYLPGPLLVILTPDHAKMFDLAGWTKNAIREHIHARATNEVPMIRGRGIVPVRPKSFENMHPMPVTRFPEDIEIVVVGGRGGHNGVILPWALHSEGIVEPVALPDGSLPRSIESFKR